MEPLSLGLEILIREDYLICNLLRLMMIVAVMTTVAECLKMQVVVILFPELRQGLGQNMAFGAF